MDATLTARATGDLARDTGSKGVAEQDVLDGGRLPEHIAIIMDGNGRWAKARGMARTRGHRAGLDALRRCITRADERKIRYLTIFAFSSENWSRPKSEIDDLFKLLNTFIRRDLKKLHRKGVRVKMIGNRDNLEPDTLRQITEAEKLTKDNGGLVLVVAFNYGARSEIIGVVRDLVASAARGEISENDITESLIADRLDTVGIPDPDLLIRTSGEKRLSNFLLWQCAYTEFVFTESYWPDFDSQMLDDAIAEYGRRDRRYGGVSEPAGT
jgi:undecaprenyl diphosphate synthase